MRQKGDFSPKKQSKESDIDKEKTINRTLFKAAETIKKVKLAKRVPRERFNNKLGRCDSCL